ncbi:unnamed protein product [Vitrella brassicaformis CCMP3155]|uniref:WH2 domain-containing protein n=1 Tax=Vitrella brassicaformis (strain CCMP3155) TaxID=1169540 RepID=A0A0G4EMQ3_VITBC|nr:unnamed protein product [Vitrella brassicaformis CCMP3155]|eukprot:CEL98292.1 unnamed protein product [Vitrella brassicaformis CCMP3155]
MVAASSAALPPLFLSLCIISTSNAFLPPTLPSHTHMHMQPLSSTQPRRPPSLTRRSASLDIDFGDVLSNIEDRLEGKKPTPEPKKTEAKKDKEPAKSPFGRGLFASKQQQEQEAPSAPPSPTPTTSKRDLFDRLLSKPQKLAEQTKQQQAVATTSSSKPQAPSITPPAAPSLPQLPSVQLPSLPSLSPPKGGEIKGLTTQQTATGVALGALPWVLAPVAAVSAGRGLLQQTKEARSVAKLRDQIIQKEQEEQIKKDAGYNLLASTRSGPEGIDKLIAGIAGGAVASSVGLYAASVLLSPQPPAPPTPPGSTPAVQKTVKKAVATPTKAKAPVAQPAPAPIGKIELPDSLLGPGEKKKPPPAPAPEAKKEEPPAPPAAPQVIKKEAVAPAPMAKKEEPPAPAPAPAPAAKKEEAPPAPKVEEKKAAPPVEAVKKEAPAPPKPSVMPAPGAKKEPVAAPAPAPAQEPPITNKKEMLERLQKLRQGGPGEVKTLVSETLLSQSSLSQPLAEDKMA